MKHPTLIGSVIGAIAGMTLAATSVYFLSGYLPGRGDGNATAPMSANVLSVQDPLSGHSFLYMRNPLRTPDPEPPSVGLPVRLRIPAIGVDAQVVPVGVTAKGAMAAPKDRNEVAWFEPGPRPGQVGSAVIAGHYGWRYGKGSSFDNLHKLRAGDRVSVEDAQGRTITFLVRKIARYNPAANSSDVFISDDGIAHLNLITCEGVWDAHQQQYTTRLIIFADRLTE